MITNLFYFKELKKIGGTEQFLYEIAKKYSKYDITILYDEADEEQVKRLRELVRCKKHIKGETIKCKQAFFNFNLDAIDDIIAEKYTFVSHANYEEIGYKPPINHPKLTHYIGVSQFAANKLDEFGTLLGKNIKTEMCYNPLTLEKCNKVKIIVCACRLDDEVKGGNRTLVLIDELDKYCEKHPEEHYIMLIFTNPCDVKIHSKNVALMPPRIDVRPFIAMADYLAQLSNDMETFGYSINEALGYGVPIITTPLSILNELPITENEHIVLDWNCKNVGEVVKQIFEKEVKPFSYIPPEDNWEEILIKKPSNYEEEKQKKYIVKATSKYQDENIIDVELSKLYDKDYIPNPGEEMKVDYFRKEAGIEQGFFTFVKEVKDEHSQLHAKKM